jgi:bacteriocin biosynthesis cyclodehydratase domain-containing protein
MKRSGLVDESARPKLRLDAQFLPIEHGVLFRSRGKLFTLKGAGIYELVSSLAPHLSGELTIRDLCEHLVPGKQEVVRHLLETLIARQVAINRVDEEISLPAAVLAGFRGQLEFIEHFSDHPIQRFSRLREANVFVTGSGPALSSICISLVRNGIGIVTLDQDVSTREQEESVAREVESLRAAGIEIRIAHSSLSSQLDNCNHLPTAICFASDEPNFGTLLQINEQCVRRDVLFIPGYVLDGKAVVGPSVRRRVGCLTCSLLRRAPHLSSDLEAEFWRGIALSQSWNRDVQPPSYPSLRILANLVAFEVFKTLTDHLARDTDGAIASVDLETLETRTARLIAHPKCPHCSTLAQGNRSWATVGYFDKGPQVVLTHDEQMSKIDSAIDPEYGIFHGFEDDGLIQTPLFRSKLLLRKSSQNQIDEIPGYSLVSNAAARATAFFEAVKRVTFGRLESPQLLPAADTESRSSPFERIDPTFLSHALGSAGFMCAPPVQWMPARSLLDDTCHQVPVAAVFPASNFNAGLFEILPGGIGVAFCSQGASEEAVSSLVASEILKRAARGEMFLQSLNLGMLAERNSDVQYLMSAFGHLGTSVCAFGFELRGYGAVVLASSDLLAVPEHIAVGSGPNVARATTQVLTELLALSLGGKSPHTLNLVLPGDLGYDLALHSVSLLALPMPDTDFDDGTKAATWFDDILICDATSPDIRTCGVTVCRALMISRAQEGTESDEVSAESRLSGAQGCG